MKADEGRSLGCLLGGAIGDALGAPVEFLGLGEIRERFGRDGVAGYAPSHRRQGAITDDTQMTLFTAEGLIRAHNRRVMEGSADAIGSLYRAYLRWDHTQREVWASFAPERSDVTGWLLGHRFLHDARAPGNTCLSALRSGRMGTIAERLNFSKGCGGVMRVAPIGLVSSEPFRVAAEAAAITHGHPSGYLSAGTFASILAGLGRGDDMVASLEGSLQELAAWPDHDETSAALRDALDLAGSAEPVPENVERLGDGWTGEEALSIAVFCALTARDFRSGVALAVNHGGDSDSTGAIAGNLLGAASGVEGLPADLLSDLEGRDVIEQVARDLHRMLEAPGEPIDPARYPAD
jgi:ADP-ribosylglycohydrolase